MKPTPETVVAKAKLSVFRVEVAKDGALSNGTCFLVAPDTIATCKHVLDGEWTVVLDDGTTLPRSSFDVVDHPRPQRDLVLLRLRSPHDVAKLAGISPLGMRPSDVAPASRLIAIGFPRIPQRATEKAIVGGHASAYTKYYDGKLRFLTCDMSLNPGFSGGPIIDEHGDVAAITTEQTVGQQATAVPDVAHHGIPSTEVLSFITTVLPELQTDGASSVNVELGSAWDHPGIKTDSRNAQLFLNNSHKAWVEIVLRPRRPLALSGEDLRARVEAACHAARWPHLFLQTSSTGGMRIDKPMKDSIVAELRDLDPQYLFWRVRRTGEAHFIETFSEDAGSGEIPPVTLNIENRFYEVVRALFWAKHFYAELPTDGIQVSLALYNIKRRRLASGFDQWKVATTVLARECAETDWDDTFVVQLDELPATKQIQASLNSFFNLFQYFNVGDDDSDGLVRRTWRDLARR